MLVAVTGGSGKLGRVVVADLLAHHYAVIDLDLQPPRDPAVAFTRVDFKDFGQTFEALTAIDDRHDGIEAVVHLGAIPGPGMTTGSTAGERPPGPRGTEDRSSAVPPDAPRRPLRGILAM